MSLVVKSALRLYSNDSRTLYQRKEVDEIEKQLNKDFENICDWFVDNKLSINFDEEKTKLRTKKSKECWSNETKKLHILQITYLGCVLDEIM